MTKKISKNKTIAKTQDLKVNNPKKFNFWLIGMTTLFAIVLIFNLFIPPLGMKTSTDFGRIMDLFSLYYQPGEMNWGSFHDIFNTNRPDNMSYNGYMTATSILLALSFIPNFIVRLFIANSSDLYYIVCLGLLQTALFIVAYYVFMASVWQRVNKPLIFIIFALFATWSLSDILFTEYFNSFFQEPAFIVAFLLFIACFLYYNSFALDIILYTIILFSKEQNLIFILLILPIFVKHKLNITRLITSAALVACVLYIYGNVNTYSKSMNSEAGVFSGLLHDSSEDEAKHVLTKIGLDPELYVLRGRDYWGNVGYIRENPNDMNLQQQFQNAATQIKRSHILLGYLYFPSKFVENYKNIIKITTETGPFVDNYSYNINGELIANYSSYFSKIMLKNTLILILINLLLVILLPIFYWRNKKLKINSGTEGLYVKKYNSEMALLFTLNFSLLFVIPANFMGDGYADLIKHCLELYFAETVNILLILFLLLKVINQKKSTT